MKTGILLTVSALLAMSCSQTSPVSSLHSPTATPSASAAPSPASSPSPIASPSPVPLAKSYGLLLVNGILEMITPDGRVGPTASVAPPTLQTCVAGLNAWLEPPVSATADKVFYRDGDTKIRYITPAGETGDATTVPGSATAVSFFSVSPDDQHIAVMIEDFSAATTISLRLYVEDLQGGGHHADIYATTTPKTSNATTLWPMGWHQGQLVLAKMQGCANQTGSLAPSEWHVANASTAVRLATIKGNCVLSFWPSRSGVACVDPANGAASVFDWTGKLIAIIPSRHNSFLASPQSGLSPSGQGIFFATGEWPGCNAGPDCPAFSTDVNASFRQAGLPYANVQNMSGACLWIDENDLLGPNNVIAVSQAPGSPTAAVGKPLLVSGVCAGRYPGGL